MSSDHVCWVVLSLWGCKAAQVENDTKSLGSIFKELLLVTLHDAETAMLQFWDTRQKEGIRYTQMILYHGWKSTANELKYEIFKLLEKQIAERHRKQSSQLLTTVKETPERHLRTSHMKQALRSIIFVELGICQRRTPTPIHKVPELSGLSEHAR